MMIMCSLTHIQIKARFAMRLSGLSISIYSRVIGEGV